MTARLRFRTLALVAALLAFVAASTDVIVKPELIAGDKSPQSPTLNTVLVVGQP